MSSSSSSLTVYLASSSGDSSGLSQSEFEASDASVVSSLPRVRLRAVAFLFAVAAVFFFAVVFLHAFVFRAALEMEGICGGRRSSDDGSALADTALSNGTLASFSRSSRAKKSRVKLFLKVRLQMRHSLKHALANVLNFSWTSLL